MTTSRPATQKHPATPGHCGIRVHGKPMKNAVPDAFGEYGGHRTDA